MDRCEFGANWIGSFVGLVVSHPVDTIKVRQQLGNINTRTSIRNIYSHQGFRGFFYGMGYPLITTGLVDFLCCGAYEGTNSMFTSLQEMDSSYPAVNKINGQTSNTYLQHFLAGCVGGLAVLPIACPVELIKTKLQSQMHQALYKGSYACMRRIIKNYGFRGLYQGCVILAWRDIPCSGIYYLTYEMIQDLFFRSPGTISSRVGSFISSGIAGSLSCCSVVPFDVLKQRIQSDYPNNHRYTGIVDCAKQLIKNHGIQGFFRGFLPISLRAFTANGAKFLVYETVISWCN